MGSLGDKFKKLAGDQTRQLLQNFQNAQSSKSKNGYSYGKLNEDGTATLADGTTVQVEVKGRPGQYAPVFNLGNGQGLVDQPEAKFFNVDSNIKIPWMLVIQREGQYGGNLGMERPPSRVFIVNIQTEEEFDIPQEYWPGVSGPTNPGLGGPLYLSTCDFSLDSRHIVLTSVSNGLYFVDNRTNPGEMPDSPDINYTIISNWRAVDGLIQTDNLIVGKYSNIFSLLEPPTGQFNKLYTRTSVANYSLSGKIPDPRLLYSATYNPILYSDRDGNPLLDLWVYLIADSYIYEIVGTFISNIGIPDYYYIGLNARNTKTLVVKSVNTSPDTKIITEYFDTPSQYTPIPSNQYIVVGSFPGVQIYISLTAHYPTVSDNNLVAYQGSFLDGSVPQHIVGISSNFPSHSVLVTPDGDLPNNPVLAPQTSQVTNYGVMDGDTLEISNIGLSNEIIGSFPESVEVSSGRDFLNGPSWRLDGAFITTANPRYDNLIISGGFQKLVRYSQVKSSLEFIYQGLQESYQYLYSNEFAEFPSYTNQAILDGAMFGFRSQLNYWVGGQAYLNSIAASNLTMPYASETPFIVRLGASKAYSQVNSGKLPLLITSTNSSNYSFTFNLVETREVEGLYLPVKTYDLSKYFTQGSFNNFHPPWLIALISYAVTYR